MQPFFRNPGIAKVLGVKRDVKPSKYKLCKVTGGGGGINREGALINTVGLVYNFLIK